MHFLGALGNVANGVLIGSFDGERWKIGCSSNFIRHDPIEHQEELPKEETDDKENTDGAKKDDSVEAIAVEVP